MGESRTYYVAPFKKLSGELQPMDLVECQDENACFKRGKALMASTDGLVFFRIECREDGDVWGDAELLATVGIVPSEAA